LAGKKLYPTKGAENVRFKKTLLTSLVLGTLSTVGGYVFSQTYYVQPGDSLYNIAARSGTTVDALIRSNNLSSTNLFPGQALQIGYTSGSAGTAAHTVQPGESLYLIAQRYNTTVEALKRANNLSNNYLVAGQRLTIPTVASNSGNASYTVRKGDTMYLIAKNNGISLSELLRVNNLSGETAIYPGQVIQLPKSISATSTSYISQNDLDLLARLVSAESSGESFEGQVAVAATILNRLRDPRYPNTIPGVIYQINYGCYQYSPVLDGRINQTATASAYKAAQLALSGWDPSKGANGFFNPDKTSSQWVRSHPVTVTIGNHVFFYY
jgi:N-acetylmuramoyl-L-alanine amidase